MPIFCQQTLKANQTHLIVLWLDTQIGSSSSSPIKNKNRLAGVKNLKEIESEEECEQYIHMASLIDTIILITSNTLAKNVIQSIHQQCQLARMFVYDDVGGSDTLWTLKYSKVKLIKLDMLEGHIKRFRCWWLRYSCRDFLPMNIFNKDNINIERSSTDINGTFLFSQLFLDILLKIKPSTRDKDDFVRECAKMYHSRCQQTKDLEDFNIHYREEDVLEWYTKNTFIFQLLNKGLRMQNIDLIFLLRFFIHDLKKQLELHRCPDAVRVYRGQLMSKSELSHWKDSIDKFISMNSFLSTSKKRDVALHFIGVTDGIFTPAPPDFEYVLFEIDADPNLNGGVAAFADVGGLSEFHDEEEVLFTLGTIFRLNNVRVDPLNQHLNIVSITLCDNDDHQLKSVFDVMKKEYQEDNMEPNKNGEEQHLISLGVVLLNMGYFKSANKVFHRELHTLKKQPPSVNEATCYRYIGDVHRQRNQFRTSKQWYQKALAMYSSLLPKDDLLIAKTSMCLGHAYSRTTDWKFTAWYQTDLSYWWNAHLSRRWQKSLKPYNSALDIYKRKYQDEHPCAQVAACYLSIGSAYLYTNQYALAIDNYQKALCIEEQILPHLHPALAYCHNGLARSFYHTDHRDSAIMHFEKALEIGLKSLPVGHPLVIELYYILGTTYQNMDDNIRSKEYFRKQIELLEHPRSSVMSMVDVVEVSSVKMHYICPRCGLPVWVYSGCGVFKGKPCARCLRRLLCLSKAARVSPV